LLVSEPAKRMTVENALEHPWVTNATPPNPITLDLASDSTKQGPAQTSGVDSNCTIRPRIDLAERQEASKKATSQRMTIVRSPPALLSLKQDVQIQWLNTITLNRREGDVSTTIAFSPNGKLIVSSFDTRHVRLWDVATGAAHSTLEGHRETVWGIAFSPDGKLLASSSLYDRTARLWDVATATARKVLARDLIGVSGVAFSPNGKLVAVSQVNGTVELWSVATGKSLKVIRLVEEEQ
jgi:WD40 repeat protein